MRLSYARNTETNEIAVLDRNDYYPFGMNFVVSQKPLFAPKSGWENYKYNGKELQETGMTAMDFRHYMTDIGRFTGMDRLSEILPTLTPYRFAFNNPIYFSDPTGLLEETNSIGTCPNCPKTPVFSPFINADDEYFYDKQTNKVFLVGQIEEVVITREAKPETTEGSDWYTHGGQANWFFATGSTIAGIRGMQNSERMYAQGWRRGISKNYQLTGRNRIQFRKMPPTKSTMPVSSLTKWAKGLGIASLGLGIIIDRIAVSNGEISTEKANFNAVMGAYGLTGVGAIPSILYFGVDAFYPGGWTGDTTNDGTIKDVSRMIDENQAILGTGFNIYRDY